MYKRILIVGIEKNKDEKVNSFVTIIALFSSVPYHLN